MISSRKKTGKNTFLPRYAMSFIIVVKSHPRGRSLGRPHFPLIKGMVSENAMLISFELVRLKIFGHLLSKASDLKHAKH